MDFVHLHRGDRYCYGCEEVTIIWGKKKNGKILPFFFFNQKKTKTKKTGGEKKKRKGKGKKKKKKEGEKRGKIFFPPGLPKYYRYSSQP